MSPEEKTHCELLTRQLSDARDKKKGFVRAIEHRYEELLIEAAQRVKPKIKKWDRSKAIKWLDTEEISKIKRALEENVKGGYKRLQKAVKRAEKARFEYMRSLEPEPGPDWYRIDASDTSTYRTQTDAISYARSSAQHMLQCYQKGSGCLEMRVRSEKTVWGTEFIIEAQVASELDAEIVKHRYEEMPLRDWVKHCWSTGVNPRVYQPFLPYDYEAREGIDYQGKDIKKF
jgi:hypothetical protein